MLEVHEDDDAGEQVVHAEQPADGRPYRTTRPVGSAERSDMELRLLTAVNRLPNRERLVVALRYFLELSDIETATVAGIPRGTVKSRLSRALRRLRAELEDLDV